MARNNNKQLGTKDYLAICIIDMIAASKVHITEALTAIDESNKVFKDFEERDDSEYEAKFFHGALSIYLFDILQKLNKASQYMSVLASSIERDSDMFNVNIILLDTLRNISNSVSSSASVVNRRLSILYSAYIKNGATFPGAVKTQVTSELNSITSRMNVVFTMMEEIELIVNNSTKEQ